MMLLLVGVNLSFFTFTGYFLLKCFQLNIELCRFTARPSLLQERVLSQRTVRGGGQADGNANDVLSHYNCKPRLRSLVDKLPSNEVINTTMLSLRLQCWIFTQRSTAEQLLSQSTPFRCSKALPRRRTRRVPCATRASAAAGSRGTRVRPRRPARHRGNGASMAARWKANGPAVQVRLCHTGFGKNVQRKTNVNNMKRPGKNIR